MIMFALNMIIKNNFPEWDIVTATTIHQATEQLQHPEAAPIGLVIVGLTLSDENTLLFLKSMQPLAATTPCFAFSHVVDQKTVQLCKTFGIRACLPKHHPISVIVYAIQTLVSGGTYYESNEPKTPDTLLNSVTKLTCRQKDVLNLVMAGYSNKKMAATLNLSYGTIKNYMFDLMRILCVRSRLELAAALRKSGYQPSLRDYET